jgi:hypothetical protein
MPKNMADCLQLISLSLFSTLERTTEYINLISKHTIWLKSLYQVAFDVYSSRFFSIKPKLDL